MNLFLFKAAKKLIVYLIIIFIPTILIVRANPSLFYGEYFAYYTIQHHLNEIEKKSKKSIILGDSRALSGIQPRILSKNFINLSLEGGTFFEDYCILRNILQKGTKIDTIILCHGPTHLEKSHWFNHILQFNNIINVNNLIDLYSAEKKSNSNYNYKSQEPTFEDCVNRIFTLYHLPPSNFINNYIYNKRSNFNCEKFIKKINDQKGFTSINNNDSTKDLNLESSQKEFIYNPVINNYLLRINELVIDNKIVCVFFTPPISKISYSHSRKAYYNDYLATLRQLNKKLDINFIDSIFIYPNNNFGDASHLNKRGAINFTYNVKSLISSN